MNAILHTVSSQGSLSGLKSQSASFPVVMIEEELIRFLRIPEISSAKNYRHVIENLKRTGGLPRIHLCGKAVYLTDAVKTWLENRITCGQ